MQLTITPETEALLQQQLKSGRFKTPDDLIATALHVLSDLTPTDLSALNAGIREGLDDIARGDHYSESEARADLASVRAKL